MEKKWTKKFIKWCKDNYDPKENKFNCDGMFICNFCSGIRKEKFANCVETIKRTLIYGTGCVCFNDFDFEDQFKTAEDCGRIIVETIYHGENNN